MNQTEQATAQAWTIYALCDHTGIIRYVGVTRLDLRSRLENHMGEASTVASSNRKCEWVRSLVAKGHRPTICELERVYSASDADAAEKKWIDMAKRFGCDLVNSNVGGHGAMAGRPVSTGRGKDGPRLNVRFTAAEMHVIERVAAARHLTAATFVREAAVAAAEAEETPRA